MKQNAIRLAVGWLSLVITLVLLSPASAAAQQRLTMTVAGVKREALIYPPTRNTNTAAPVVFVFHGHGGTAENAARSFGLHRHWPEAIIVYPQGLNTPGQLTDPEGKRAGWQKWPGDQEDRDLKFFDSLLKTVKATHAVDEKRIYATGHSNGGGFTYLLWATRYDVLRAVAPSAAAPNARYARDLKPKPAMHLAGRKDSLVKFEWQEKTMELVRKVNGCAESGRPWEKSCTFYESTRKAPFISFIHGGGHQFPAEAPGLMVKFLRDLNQ